MTCFCYFAYRSLRPLQQASGSEVEQRQRKAVKKAEPRQGNAPAKPTAHIILWYPSIPRPLRSGLLVTDLATLCIGASSFYMSFTNCPAVPLFSNSVVVWLCFSCVSQLVRGCNFAARKYAAAFASAMDLHVARAAGSASGPAAFDGNAAGTAHPPHNNVSSSVEQPAILFTSMNEATQWLESLGAATTPKTQRLRDATAVLRKLPQPSKIDVRELRSTWKIRRREAGRRGLRACLPVSCSTL